MAGDKVDIATRAWVPYAASAPDDTAIEPVSLFNSLLNALSSGAAGLSGGHTTPGVLQGTGSSMPPGITSFLSSHNDVVLPSPPKAYLNWILFDEQFRYVPEGSGFTRVGYYDDGRLQTLANSGLPIAKSGYLFVYLSNESKKPVFFDNLVVQHYLVEGRDRHRAAGRRNAVLPVWAGYEWYLFKGCGQFAEQKKIQRHGITIW